MKKNCFLIIAIVLSLLFHLLIFIFAPELKSEINSNDYAKKITKISIFQEVAKPESVPTIPDPPKSRNSVKKRVVKKVDEKENTPRDIETSQSRDIVQESTPQDIETSESSDIIQEITPQDVTTSGSSDIVQKGTSHDVKTSESSDIIQESGTPRRAGELAVIPKALNPKTPLYPETLEDEGIEGNVTLELLISKEGKVLNAKVIKSDHELFSKSALNTVKNYRFTSGKLKDGSAVDSLIEFVIKFEISL